MSRRTLAGAAILAAAIAWVGLDQARCERRGLWSLAAWLSGREHDAAAAWVLGALATLRPDCALAHRDLGAALYRADRFEPALEAARRAAALDPGDSEAPRLIGNALMHLGRHGEAVDWFARAAGATELEGRPSTALRNLEGFARYKAGDLPGALAIFESLAEREPDFVLGWVNRALTLERLGRSPEADAALAHAFSLAPRHPTALYASGALRCLRGDAEGCAARVMEAVAAGYRAWRYIESDPDTAPARALAHYAAFLRSAGARDD